MTQGIFHITVATLTGTMAVFGVTIATAPSRGGDAAPAIAPAAAIPAAPVAAPQPAAAPSDPRLDGCVIEAIGRLPKADGLRVTKSSYQFYLSDRQSKIWTVSVSVDVHGHQATYEWLCSLSNDGIAVLVAKRGY